MDHDAAERRGLTPRGGEVPNFRFPGLPADAPLADLLPDDLEELAHQQEALVKFRTFDADVSGSSGS